MANSTHEAQNKTEYLRIWIRSQKDGSVEDAEQRDHFPEQHFDLNAESVAQPHRVGPVNSPTSVPGVTRSSDPPVNVQVFNIRARHNHALPNVEPLASPTLIRRPLEIGALTTFSRRTGSHRTASPTLSRLSSSTPAPSSPLAVNPTPISAELAAANARIQALEEEIAVICAQRNRAEAQGIMAMREIAHYKHILKGRLKKSSHPTSTRPSRFHTSAHIVINDHGRAAETLAKQTENLRGRAVEGSTRVFSGSLNVKNKTQLKDLADALQLPTGGKKDDLMVRITQFFDANPSIKDDERYSAIFNRTRGRKRAAPQPDDVQGPDYEIARAAPNQRRRTDSGPSRSAPYGIGDDVPMAPPDANATAESRNPPMCALPDTHTGPSRQPLGPVRLNHLIHPAHGQYHHVPDSLHPHMRPHPLYLAQPPIPSREEATLEYRFQEPFLPSHMSFQARSRINTQ